jgi:ATP-dependent helicase/nuclease subunit A
MSKSLLASTPHLSATVSASAGTGKTWLLVTRLIRLLLADARPDGILAVTFTRKAAAEMQTRLNDRLREMAQCEPPVLRQRLEEIGADTDDTTLARAATLYEDLLRSPFTIKATTFHAFCQDILRRFPLEAGIAPGFELLETSAEFQQAAWDALCSETSRRPDSDLAQAVETLFDTCGSLANTTTALNGFLNHRSDWWAFSEGQPEPLSFAIDTLRRQLEISPADLAHSPEQSFFSEQRLSDLAEFVALLRKHDTKGNRQALEALALARDHSLDAEQRFTAVCQAFLTAKGTPLARKASKTQAASMGEDGQQRFLLIHTEQCTAIEATQARRNAFHALRRMTAWYRAGNHLLETFQQLKAEQRVLDFADLEWRAYRLLNHGDNVHWIQYKLDQRIDHLLIDEFQDTNPTQWRLLLPLLQELAAGEEQRQRSVFLVGDNKQSIYRFRRADPELFITAQDWLQQHLSAVSQPLDVSWRSAAAIMTFVNKVFGDGPLHKQLMHFSAHSTHHPQLWGRVEFLPLAENAVADEQLDGPNPNPDPAGLRDPLQTAREVKTDQRHLAEGRLIAAKIGELMATSTAIGPAHAARPMQYRDVIILFRNRSHVGDYEQALREAGIPYVGAERGTLLQSLEVQDMVRLLELLITPFNNLALASLLRSPLFDCPPEDLIALAAMPTQQAGSAQWMERLAILASQRQVQDPLHRAHRLLTSWREHMGTMPVHDLLDRIYCEADALNRYHAAYPRHLQHRVGANLTRFLELALEIDSGRYPSIGHFVARLRSLRQQEQEAPDEGLPMQAESRVRLMTIHGAKGLEAPIVFLADSVGTATGSKAHQAIVDWPAQSARPDSFLLAGKKEQQDRFTHSILARHEQAEAREEANLLYVAITRPKQFLFISGCRPNRGNNLGWYGLLAAQCGVDESDAEKAQTLPAIIESGQPGVAEPTAAAIGSTPSSLATPELKQTLSAVSAPAFIAPSHSVTTQAGSREADGDGRLGGVVIHRLLQLLCEGNAIEAAARRVAAEQTMTPASPVFQQWLNEAQQTYRHPDFAWIFAQPDDQASFNEVPLQYRQQDKTVLGIIDRLLVTDTEAWVVDYKTHSCRDAQALADLAQQYYPQIDLYCQGVRQLWPEKRVRGGLLFTHAGEFRELSC